MHTERIQTRDKQRDSWNSFSGGWHKWDDFTMRFLKEQEQSILEELYVKPTDQVLDIASGTGEPGLTIATTIGNGGPVTATDLSEQMLEIAKTKARAMGVHNFRVEVADACDLTFEADTLDAISCRLAFIFFPDMQLSAAEMMRVLKPGGRLVTTVWAEPEKNVWITTIMSALKKHIDMQAPNPQAPGMFRCAAPGFLTALFSGLGLPGGTEKTS